MSSAIRRDTVLRLARRTLACPTAPFREGEVIAWVREFAAARPWLRLREDSDGNLELRRRGVRARASPLVLAAHLDHPGFRALGSRRDGDGWRVEAHFLGGVAPEYFPGARARFYTDGGEGRQVVARVERLRRPRPRRPGRDGRRRGKRSRRPQRPAAPWPTAVLRAREPVPPGAFGTWDLPGFRRSPRDPDRIATRAADDLAGVAAILALLDAVERIDPRRRVDVRGLLTRAEEVGFLGALAVARGQRLPRGARILAVEASKALPHAPQGAGPILRVGDRTSIFDDALTRWMTRVAQELAAQRGARFAWQRRLMDGGTCESTAYQLYGYACAAVCLPLGSYHNMGPGGRIAAETIRLSDLVGLVRLFEGLVRAEAAAPRRGRRADPLRERLERLLHERRGELARDPFAS